MLEFKNMFLSLTSQAITIILIDENNSKFSFEQTSLSFSYILKILSK